MFVECLAGKCKRSAKHNDRHRHERNKEAQVHGREEEAPAHQAQCRRAPEVAGGYEILPEPSDKEEQAGDSGSYGDGYAIYPNHETLQEIW